MTPLRLWPRLRALIAIITSFALVTAPTGPAWAQDNQAQTLSRGRLQQLVAPIALYPDSLLTQVLMAATYPLDVVQAARWRRTNPGVRGERLEDVLESRTWDESVKALTVFPDVLRMMDERLEWTEQLGEAFLAQQEDLLAAVQDLRRRAARAGHLKSSKELNVVRSDDGDGELVVIEQVDPDAFYLPVYGPDVYGAWSEPDYPPYDWYPGARVPGRVLWFAAAAVIGTALWARWDWKRRQVAVDPVRFNKFNRSARTPTTWQHDPQRRRGVAYKAPALANRFTDAKGRPVGGTTLGKRPAHVAQTPAGHRRPGSAATAQRAPLTTLAPKGKAVPTGAAVAKQPNAAKIRRAPVPAVKTKPVQSPPVARAKPKPPVAVKRVAPPPKARPQAKPQVRKAPPPAARAAKPAGAPAAKVKPKQHGKPASG
jgi:hypothetical protein